MLDTIPPIALAAIAILIGFGGLVWSADRFVAGSAAIAKSFGVAPLVIGLTIVSFGTSAPEVMVSISASLKDAGDLAIGNALGSNIANIGLVLGATLLIAAIPVQKHIFRHELPVLLLVTVISGALLYGGVLSPWEGWLLLALLPVLMLYLVRAKQKELSPAEIDLEQEDIPEMPRPRAILWFAIGLVALMLSSEVLVWGAKTTAEYFSVSPLIIGLTVIAVGTSLPELAASVMSALKGHHDIALGNIIGSNIFNLLAVMAVPGIISPPIMEAAVFNRDYMTMLGITLIITAAIAIVLLRKNTKGTSQLGKGTGFILLACYVAYYAYLFYTN